MTAAALITGAASGIGRACAMRLAADGLAVAAVDRDSHGAQATATAINDDGGQAVAVTADVTSENELADAVTTARELGHLSAVVTAAGLFQPVLTGADGEDWASPRAGFIESTPLATWDLIVDVNLRGTLLTLRAVGPHLESGSCVVTVASGAALIPFGGRSSYCVSKAGVWMLTKVAALEYAPRGVRVNCVAPGHILSPMTADLFGDSEVRASTEATIPLGALGTPEDVASTVSFLCGPDAAYLTGQMVNPDGGLFTR